MANYFKREKKKITMAPKHQATITAEVGQNHTSQHEDFIICL